MLTTYYDRDKAVRLNPAYARSTGWIDKYQQLAVVLGFEFMSPGPQAFADAVYDWQAKTPPLKADGILGPNSWKKLEPLTHFTPAGPPAPDWVRKLPPKRVEQEAEVKVPTNIWMGMMMDFGGMVAYYGENAMIGTLRSFDDPNRCFDVMANRIRLGVGLGGGIGFSLVLVTNMKKASELNGMRTQSYDFNLSVGVPLIKAAKSAIKMPRLIKAIDRIEGLVKAGNSKAVRAAAREATELKPDEFATLAKFVREMDAFHDSTKKKDTLQVTAFTLPLPGALEASVFWQQEDWSVL